MINKLVGTKLVAIAKTWYKGFCSCNKFPSFRQHVSIMLPTMAVWGSVGGVALVHFTDWRLILDYVPYVNGKFKNDE